MADKVRLVDANALIKQFEGGDEMKSMEESTHDERFVEALQNAPTVDAVEVVRCKDCKHSGSCEDGTILCRFHSEHGERYERNGEYGVWMEPTDFCSYGERKDT